jgi:hypothetical protein
MTNVRQLTCRAMIWLILATASVSTAAAQVRMSRTDAALAASRRFEGMTSISKETINKVLSDPSTLEMFRDALDGRTAWPTGADTAYVLYYLLLSGRAEFVPEYLRFAHESAAQNPPNTFRVALYGLSEHAALPEARMRLLTLGASTVKSGYRMHLVYALTLQNSVATRDILPRVSLSGMPHGLRDKVSATLQAPPRKPQ